MKNHPLPVIIVSFVFIVAGLAGFIYHLQDFFAPGAIVQDLVGVEVVRIIAVICGLLLLRGVNWARWLAIAWMLFHVIISAFNSFPQMIAHIVILLIVIILLYLPVSSRFFQTGKKK